MLGLLDIISERLSPGEVAALIAGLASSFGWGLGCLLFDRLQTARHGPSPLERRGIRPPTAAAMNLFKNTIACAVFLVAAAHRAR